MEATAFRGRRAATAAPPIRSRLHAQACTSPAAATTATTRAARAIPIPRRLRRRRRPLLIHRAQARHHRFYRVRARRRPARAHRAQVRRHPARARRRRRRHRPRRHPFHRRFLRRPLNRPSRPTASMGTGPSTPKPCRRTMWRRTARITFTSLSATIGGCPTTFRAPPMAKPVRVQRRIPTLRSFRHARLLRCPRRRRHPRCRPTRRPRRRSARRRRPAQRHRHRRRLFRRAICAPTRATTRGTTTGSLIEIRTPTRMATCLKTPLPSLTESAETVAPEASATNYALSAPTAPIADLVRSRNRQ